VIDRLSQQIKFYPIYPNEKSHSSWWYLSPKNDNARKQDNTTQKKTYVSCLRRAIDTWLYSMWPVTGQDAHMTCDIQEVTVNGDGKIDDGKRKKSGGKPTIGKRQVEAIEKLAGHLPPNEKTAAVKAEGDRVTAVYNSLNLGPRIEDHQGWPSGTLDVLGWLKGKNFNDLFLKDLENDLKAGINVVLASGHSLYWKALAKTYSDPKGTCKEAGENKLANGSVMAMVVKFNADGTVLKENPVAACQLVFGSLHGITSYPQPTKEILEKELKQENGGKQILLFVIRHGRSFWNEASEKPEHGEKKGTGLIPEVAYVDSPLWTTGVLDAIRLNNRLTKDESPDQACSKCAQDTTCTADRLCASVYIS